MKAVFHQTAPKEGCYGDCSADYAVVLDKTCTVREFLEWVIKDRSNEWGCIGIASKDEKWAQFCKVKCKYKWGKMQSSLPEKYLDMTVCSVTGHGGWTNMDYMLVVKGGKPCHSGQ